MYIVSNKISSLLTPKGVIENGKEVKKEWFDSKVFDDLCSKGIIIKGNAEIIIEPEKVEVVKEVEKVEEPKAEQKEPELFTRSGRK